MIKTPDPVDVEVGRRICSRRMALGRNQSDLGRAIGVTFQQVQKYEKGANRVSASMLTRIAAYLSATPAAFFPDTDGTDIDDAPISMLGATPHGHELADLFVRMDTQQRSSVLSVSRAMVGAAAVRQAARAA